MPQFGKRIPGAGRRATVRSPALHAARLVTNAIQRVVVARDVSSTGARLYGAQLPEEGAHVDVTIGSVQAGGEVVWSQGADCGVHFTTPVDPEEVGEVVRPAP